ncbi:MAG: ACT domain-containing protein [Gammaproteobacteria bacterium]|nr:ACT domain-containing protein [Gammaproteobacteria bacterium]
MTATVTELRALLRSLRPELNAGTYIYASLTPGTPRPPVEAVAEFTEREGRTLVVEEAAARRAGLVPLFRAAWITLTVHSDLAAVGLTAAVSAALAAEGIACNVIAAAHHDHLFVPVEQAAAAMKVLESLSDTAAT